MANLVSYTRVSTQMQLDSGLGLEAQRDAIRRYAAAGGHTILQEFVEMGSGGNNDRIEMHKAIDLCKITGATLIFKALDRISRDFKFIVDLMDSDVNFIITDMLDANKLTLRIMGCLAEWEREAISNRTKAALQAAKARGTVLGSAGRYNLTLEAKARGREESARLAKENAAKFAKRIEPILLDCQQKKMNLKQIAERLTELQVRSARGKTTWYPSMVSNCFKTLERM